MRYRFWVYLLPVIMCACGLSVAADNGPAPSQGDKKTSAVSAAPIRHPRLNTLTKRRWGVELVSVSLASAGYMLEFRYRVLDAAKAKPLFERKTKPFLIDEATGAQMAVPAPAKVGPLRNSDPPITGKVYWMLFANPARLVKPGNRVTVVIGEFRAEGLIVN